jgi:serine/threonine protein phosphatase 1
MPRTFALGDIHGCDVALRMLLAQVPLRADDVLIVLGDVIDRGPRSREVIDLLLDVAERCRLISVMGNHEEMLLDVLSHARPIREWLDLGGQETLLSYGGIIDDIPDEHRAYLAGMVDYWETDTDIFIHASLHPDEPMDRQRLDRLRWKSLQGNELPHYSDKRVICGHTPQSGEPLAFDGWLCIDTGAHQGGWLTLLETGQNIAFQANERGEFRYARL